MGELSPGEHGLVVVCGAAGGLESQHPVGEVAGGNDFGVGVAECW